MIDRNNSLYADVDWDVYNKQQNITSKSTPVINQSTGENDYYQDIPLGKNKGVRQCAFRHH